MDSLVGFALKERFAKVKKLKSKLSEIKGLIDWETFDSLFPERETGPGRPPYSRVLMVKVLFLQSWYGLSDEETEYQINDRLSFQEFLEFPKTVPDFTTIWYFREEIKELQLEKKIWDELQRQISSRNLKVKKGVIQDATFVTADPGMTRSGLEGRGDEAKTSRSKDGTWAKKGKKSSFGFKLHTKVRRGSKIIEGLDVTPANIHDGDVDLATPDDIMYRDKGYTGKQTVAIGDGTMKRGKLTVKQQQRNNRICKKRKEGEHPFGTMKRSLKAGHTRLTTTARVFTQQLFVCFAYNLHRLRFLLSS